MLIKNIPSIREHWGLQPVGSAAVKTGGCDVLYLASNELVV